MNTAEQAEALVRKLGEETAETERDGYRFTVKKIPDGEASGQLDPRVYDVLGEQAIPPFSNVERRMEAEDVRQMRAMMGWPNTSVTRTAVETVCRKINGVNGPIPLRIYTPEGSGPRPAVVFFHGGGFIGGTVDVMENPCRALAEKAGAVVVSADYRLAPEHAFPAGLTDCFETVQWVHRHARELGADPGRIAVAGDSAGGNLAAVCAIMDRDRGTGMIRFQALLYPTVNVSGTETEDFRWSEEAYDIRGHRDRELILGGLHGLGGSFPGLIELYLQGRTESTHPYVSPLLAGDLGNLPETLIVTAEYDYLRLEDEAYACKLARSGVSVRMIRYNGMDHAFLDKLGLYPQAEDCLNEMAREMKRVFA
ncbi:alpha/beta hydrolase [Paenibacillus chitinolyticus]|uniref:alpha/beta hydrolase n=1 Tax=Paenibacillus chitinolyticus TaxID=79263 RepID=UPI002DBBE748|nr:alpha/beta hydrolase [Paenibacillus chitinolyticus]MEC0244391.1 alpha/beta hydrolase [Paenibacillus chitinolyticus]